MRSRRDLAPVSLGAEENTALYMVILVTVVSGWWAKNKVQASDMVQLVKVLASKHDNLNLVLGTHTIGGNILTM